MAKTKSTPATTEYVNFQIEEAKKETAKMIEEVMSQLKDIRVEYQNSTAAAAPIAPEKSPEKVEVSEAVEDEEYSDDLEEEVSTGPDVDDDDDINNWDDPDLMSDKEYLFQVFPDLHRVVGMTPDEQYQEVLNRYRDKAVATLVTKELERIVQKEHQEIQATLDEELARRINAWKAESDRRLKQLDTLEKKVEAESAAVLKTARDLDAHYRRAVQLETLKERRSGLFIMGRHLLPFWFVVLATAILLIAGFFTVRFALATSQTNKTLQYELIHTIQQHPRR